MNGVSAAAAAPAQGSANGVGGVAQAPQPAQQPKKPIFEVPKTMDSLRNDVGEWSLADDVGLMVVLEEISGNLRNKMMEVEKEVDELVHSSSACHVALRNTFTSFAMLSHSQFVENRVYEEDEAEITKEGAKNAKLEQKSGVLADTSKREEVLVPKYSKALATSYQALRWRIRSTQDDTAPSTPNPFATKALPSLIGSSAYNSDDRIGLTAPVRKAPQQPDWESSDDEPWPSQTTAQSGGNNAVSATQPPEFGDGEGLFGEDRKSVV